MCWVYFHKTTNHGKIKSKNRKTHNYPSVRKSYSTSRTGIGGRKKKEVISKSKTTALTYFDKLKKKQQDQGGKYFYFSFICELWSNGNFVCIRSILPSLTSVIRRANQWTGFYMITASVLKGLTVHLLRKRYCLYMTILWATC